MKTFEELIQQNKPTLVDFTASWCGPCKMMSPVLKEVKMNVGEKASIIKIDVDQNPEMAARYGVQGVPTLLLFKEGKIVWRKSGVTPARQLEDVIFSNQ